MTGAGDGLNLVVPLASHMWMSDSASTMTMITVGVTIRKDVTKRERKLSTTFKGSEGTLIIHLV